MYDLVTPDQIIKELNQVRAEASRGLTALYEAEIKYAETLTVRETAEAKAFLSAEGNIAERQAIAKMITESLRFDEFLFKAELTRIKTKMRLLESEQSNIQTQARLVELMYRSAGHGER